MKKLIIFFLIITAIQRSTAQSATAYNADLTRPDAAFSALGE